MSNPLQEGEEHTGSPSPAQRGSSNQRTRQSENRHFLPLQRLQEDGSTLDEEVHDGVIGLHHLPLQSNDDLDCAQGKREVNFASTRQGQHQDMQARLEDGIRDSKMMQRPNTRWQATGKSLARCILMPAVHYTSHNKNHTTVTSASCTSTLMVPARSARKEMRKQLGPMLPWLRPPKEAKTASGQWPVGFANGPVVISPISSYYLGAKEANALEAEANAMQWALLWILAWEGFDAPPVEIHGDNLLTVETTLARWRIPSTQKVKR